MKIGQFITDQDIIEWYSRHYEMDYSDSEETILDWLGGDESRYITDNEFEEQWVRDLFKSFPELKGTILVIYNH